MKCGLIFHLKNNFPEKHRYIRLIKDNHKKEWDWSQRIRVNNKKSGEQEYQSTSARVCVALFRALALFWVS